MKNLWRELPLTRVALQERGLRVHGVWTMHIGLTTPPRVYVDWQEPPNRLEKELAKHIVVAHRVVHSTPGDEKPWREH